MKDRQLVVMAHPRIRKAQPGLIDELTSARAIGTHDQRSLLGFGSQAVQDHAHDLSPERRKKEEDRAIVKSDLASITLDETGAASAKARRTLTCQPGTGRTEAQFRLTQLRSAN